MALFLVIVIAQNVEGAEDLKLSASAVNGNAGEQVKVGIMVENAKGTEGGQFVLTFDPALVRPVSLEAGKLVVDVPSSLHMANLEYAPGQLMYMWITATADTADAGTVGTITFELLKAGETRLEFKDVVIAPEGYETVAADPGRITIKGTDTDAGVAEEGNGNDNDRIGREETDNGKDNGNEAENNNEAEDPANDQAAAAAGTGNNYFLIIGLVISAVLVAAGLLAYKKLKKAGT